MLSTVRRVAKFWARIWKLSVAETLAPLRLNLSAILRFLVGAGIILVGTYYALGVDDTRKRLVFIFLSLLGSLVWVAIGFAWRMAELPARTEPEPEASHPTTLQLWLSLLIAAALALPMCYFLAAGTGKTLSAYVNPSPTSPVTPPSSSTVAPSNTPTTTATPTQTPSPTATPDYRPAATCARESAMPCYYTVREADSAQSISLKIVGTMSHAGRIADLFRDDYGFIKVLEPGEVLVVPDPGMPRDTAYLSYYLGYLACSPEVRNPEWPCMYVSTGEPYELLASRFYSGGKDAMIALLKQANDIFFDQVTREVIPIPSFTKGDIVIVPAWP
jgi:hypothetical protein